MDSKVCKFFPFGLVYFFVLFFSPSSHLWSYTLTNELTIHFFADKQNLPVLVRGFMMDEKAQGWNEMG